MDAMALGGRSELLGCGKGLELSASNSDSKRYSISIEVLRPEVLDLRATGQDVQVVG